MLVLLLYYLLFQCSAKLAEQVLRRDGRAAEGACLESRYGGNSIGGSNPSLSAKICLQANFGEIRESFETLSDARQKEKFYKSTTGRRRLKDMLLR